MTTTTKSISAALSSLVSSGASWQPVKEVGDTRVHTLSNIRYGQESPLQSLDLFLPDEFIAGTQPPLSSSLPIISRPVYIHIHGGGWSRGSKDSPFYGGPAMSQNAAASGCIAVAPGYRLGKYPEFVHDAASAIKWVQDHIADFGGDLSNVFLSGHSAGGHIASLIVLRHSCFLAPLGIPRNFFRGLILVSGVYDLFSPLRKAPLDAKNKWFVVAYVMPSFGTDETLRKEASPLLLLNPKKDTSILGKAAMLIRTSLMKHSKESSADVIDHEQHGLKLNTADLPSTLILNAKIDMGLQENGELMAAAMSKYTNVKYLQIPGTDHASICWNSKTASEVTEFIEATCYRPHHKMGKGDKDIPILLLQKTN